MPSDAAQLATIKTQTLAVMADLTVNPKPTYMVDGQMVSWGDYLSQLRATVEWCNAQLAAETPFEIHSRGYP
ncbi:MAG TPA: hypothetical protein VMY42_29085 [Thermoguttaceae bacterium]|nr:hypothetical protein [Thermoguttaceae bacterium]